MGKWVEMHQSHHLLEEACLTPQSRLPGLVLGGLPADSRDPWHKDVKSCPSGCSPNSRAFRQTLGLLPTLLLPALSLPPECPCVNPLCSASLPCLGQRSWLLPPCSLDTPSPQPPVLVSRPPPPARPCPAPA